MFIVFRVTECPCRLTRRFHRRGQSRSDSCRVAGARNASSRFVKREGIDLIRFQRGERKDDRAHQYLRRFSGGEGVLFVGKAQEKAHVVRTERRHEPNSDRTYPWLVSSTAMVNYYYFYLVDEDFGPLFIKFCSYFPFNAKLCINGPARWPIAGGGSAPSIPSRTSIASLAPPHWCTE